MKLYIAAIIVSAALASPAKEPPDLTAADAKTFKAHLGKIVSVRGRLEHGKEGACLFGATPEDVVFYIILDVSSGSYSWPDAWMRLTHHQVRVTGELKFRSFDRSDAKPYEQAAPDYYYMVVQRTEVQRPDSK